MNSGKVALGVLAGFAIGAIAGVLLAPEKGSATRKQILDEGGDLAEEIKSNYNKFSKLISKFFETTREDAEEIAISGKSLYDETKKETTKAVSEFKHSS